MVLRELKEGRNVLQEEKMINRRGKCLKYKEECLNESLMFNGVDKRFNMVQLTSKGRGNHINSISKWFQGAENWREVR